MLFGKWFSIRKKDYPRYFYFISLSLSLLFFISPFGIIRQLERISYRTSVGVQAREKWRPPWRMDFFFFFLLFLPLLPLPLLLLLLTRVFAPPWRGWVAREAGWRWRNAIWKQQLSRNSAIWVNTVGLACCRRRLSSFPPWSCVHTRYAVCKFAEVRIPTPSPCVCKAPLPATGERGRKKNAVQPPLNLTDSRKVERMPSALLVWIVSVIKNKGRGDKEWRNSHGFDIDAWTKIFVSSPDGK